MARRSAKPLLRPKSSGYACRTDGKRFLDAGSTPAASTKFQSQTVLLLSGTLFFLLRLRSAVDECVAGRLPENIRTTARKYGKSCWGPKNRLCRQFP